jgi:hypothetical protein
MFSPDENWFVLNERANLNDSSCRLYHRQSTADLQFVEVGEPDRGGSLTDAAWRFYLKEVELPDNTAREQVRLSAVQWKSDSAALRLRFDSFGAEGQKLLPVAYTCAYDVAAQRFISETDVAGIRSRVKTVPPSAALAAAPPAPANNGSWQTTLSDFATNFVRVNESSDTNAVVDCYAPTVNYFDRGTVDQNVIRTDVQQYNSRWPIRRNEIENNSIARQEIVPGSDYLVSFNHVFVVESPAHRDCIKGKLGVTMHVSLAGDRPKITAIQEKKLEQEKGTLQVTSNGYVPVWPSSKQRVARGTPPPRGKATGKDDQMTGLRVLEEMSRNGLLPIPRRRP